MGVQAVYVSRKIRRNICRLAQLRSAGNFLSNRTSFFFIYPNWTSAIDACFPRLVRELRPQLEISLLDGWLQHDATRPKWFLVVGRKLCQFPQKPFSEVRRIGVGLDGKHHEGGWMGYRGVEGAE